MVGLEELSCNIVNGHADWKNGVEMNIKSLMNKIFNNNIDDKRDRKLATTDNTDARNAKPNQQGEWRQLQQDITEEIENGSSVDYGMGINYAGNKFRPSSFDAKYTVNGTAVRRINIANEVND